MKKVYCFAALFGAILGVSLASCSSDEEELNENPISEKVAYDNKDKVDTDEEILFSTFDEQKKNGLKSSTILTYDIKILHGNSNDFPAGQYIGNDGWYNKLDIDLNEGAGGEWIYLYYRTASNVEDCVTNMAAIASTRWYSEADLRKCMSDYAGAWYPGRDQNNNPVDLNAGSGGKYVYLELSKDNMYGRITGFQVVSTTKDYTYVKSKVEDGRTYYPVKCYTDILNNAGRNVLWQAMDFNMDTNKHKKNIYIYYTRD